MRNRSLKLLSIIALCLVSQIALALPPFQAKYELIRDGLTAGEVELSLTAMTANEEQPRYIYRRSSRTAGLIALFRDDTIIEESHFLGPVSQPKPVYYRYNRTGKKPRLVSIDFDWKTSRASNLYLGQRWELAVPDDVVDKLSVELRLGADLHRARTTAADDDNAASSMSKNTEFVYTIADGGHLKTYRYRWLRRENVETPMGEFQAEVIERRHDNHARATTLWFAPAMNYAIVKILHSENGDGSLEMLITDFRAKQKTP